VGFLVFFLLSFSLLLNPKGEGELFVVNFELLASFSME
jgi:hypothetical protein